VSCQAEGQASSEWSGAAEAQDGETGYLTYSTYVEFTYHTGTSLDGGLGVNADMVYHENSCYNVQKFQVFDRISEPIQVEGYPRLATRRSNIEVLESVACPTKESRGTFLSGKENRKSRIWLPSSKLPTCGRCES
jgi:hypothetical protein